MDRADSLSSDEDLDDDRETLIDQNDRKHHHLPITSPRRSDVTAFQISDGSRDARRRFASVKSLRDFFNKRRGGFVVFFIFVPLFVLLLFFSTDIKSLLFSPHRLSNSVSGDLLRESELRALYLLRQQQLSLFGLWNQTNLNSTAATGNLAGDLKSAVLRQISLNKEIQQTLLAPHGSGNLSESSENLHDPRFVGGDRCGIVDQRFSERRTIEWKPDSNKYLLAICVSGQTSNHLICLEKHMFFAALLNRVLVIPSSKVDYQYSTVLDIEHINRCVGQKVLVTFEELAEEKKNHVHIDRFICYFAKPMLCYVDDEHLKKLKGLGVSFKKPEAAWVEEDVKKPSKKSVEDVKGKFASGDEVIAIGDVFFAGVEQDWVMQPGGPLAHKCKTLIEPSRLILVTAQRFIQTFLGKNFVALHFRQHGLLKFCNNKKPSCFYPIPQAADCITRVAERANAPVVYLSTNAAESETGLLQSLVVVNGKTVPLVKRPARNSAEKWDALLYRHGIEWEPQVEAMLDKTISAMSSVFIGTSESTFTEDILRLRRGWGSASVCDEYLCQGEEPNFIAENE